MPSVIKHCAMKAYSGSKGKTRILNLCISIQLYSSTALPPRERALGIHWVGGWVVPRSGLDGLAKRKNLFLPRIESLSQSP